MAKPVGKITITSRGVIRTLGIVAPVIEPINVKLDELIAIFNEGHAIKLHSNNGTNAIVTQAMIDRKLKNWIEKEGSTKVMKQIEAAGKGKKETPKETPKTNTLPKNNQQQIKGKVPTVTEVKKTPESKNEEKK